MKANLKSIILAVASSGILFHAGVQANQLEDVKAKGTLVCGVIDIYEPFGFIDPCRAMTWMSARPSAKSSESKLS